MGATGWYPHGQVRSDGAPQVCAQHNKNSFNEQNPETQIKISILFFLLSAVPRIKSRKPGAPKLQKRDPQYDRNARRPRAVQKVISVA